MIELNRNRMPGQPQSDVEQLKQIAASRRDRYRQQQHSVADLSRLVVNLLTSPKLWFAHLPLRFLLHSIVALVLPLALLLSQLPARSPATAPVASESSAVYTDQHHDAGIGSVDVSGRDTLAVLGDPPLEESDALPVPISLVPVSDVLAPTIVGATIAGDVVRMRNGPGLAYDEVSRINGGESVEVLARHEEWLQLRREGDATLYWVASELVDVPEAVLYTLDQVPSETIPPPPPPKIAVVREQNLNLRDGPGTNYVSMARMSAGQELTLVQQYNGWFLVEYGTQYGWVTTDFLEIVPGVIERVPEATTIPDPNPPLVGTVLENSVNMRRGPGSAYDRVGSVNADTGVTLLARHRDWYNVQLSNGTKAWIFSDLLRVSPMAARRVPVTNNIPALPVRTPATVARTTTTGGGGGTAAPVYVPASGDVASFAVQFVGSRYVWGGTSPSGFDCSGLSTYVYRQFGVHLPRTAASQYSSRVGAMIGGMGNLAPGDLMFFATGRGGISHVSIYIGGGQMVHAMTPRYGVQISSIWSGYWQSTYVGAVRPYR
ncbi:MAG: glycoside hydrolase [Candidatus Viridilinea halotolerans]|uniref:Glycoside hydrolase n=1 Tax=Candidatus Viridilinea halotolerans TaxID=2491704 RepID=A0A426TSY0_9CHLR|nr:MAG: glycoside hydrolase [Candidatus Viridilinea halotolerans]